MLRVVPILLVGLAGHLGAAVAVMNPDPAEPGLTSERVRDMLNGRITTWSDGTSVVVILVGGQEALTRITGRDVDRLMRGWKRLVFSGSAAMPLLASSVDEAVATVPRRHGALLVLDRAPEAAGLQVVALDLPVR
jgi:hypothetical protein